MKLTPSSYTEVAEALGDASSDGLRVRPTGGGTKLGWGSGTIEPDLEVSTRELNAVVEHNAGDLTAVLQAGVPMAEAQRLFALRGQMIGLDPPLGEDEGATIGGVVATGDSGPLRHGYRGVRDQLLGITVALSDGTVAKAGGKVIKNVAGYDLPKLFAGSFGTLGVILEVAVRLHPRPPLEATAAWESDEARAI
ncbi:MAG: FAD-binding oxidoreductase, partial [Actinomycetota bacterium]|nr:FAD-binding oxidoreductase [Actinomycetota bacterium]